MKEGEVLFLKTNFHFVGKTIVKRNLTVFNDKNCQKVKQRQKSWHFPILYMILSNGGFVFLGKISKLKSLNADINTISEEKSEAQVMTPLHVQYSFQRAHLLVNFAQGLFPLVEIRPWNVIGWNAGTLDLVGELSNLSPRWTHCLFSLSKILEYQRSLSIVSVEALEGREGVPKSVVGVGRYI